MPPHATRPSRFQWSLILASLSSWSLSFVTTAGLAGVGWLGHATHWTFGVGGHASPHASQDQELSRDRALAIERPPAMARNTISFPTKEVVNRTGIELVPVVERCMLSELNANGTVHYDDRRIAQLSARVSGSVWRVEKHLGDTIQKGDVLLVVESREVGQQKAEFLNSLVAFEASQEQVAILEEVKGAVMGRQVREAKSALREARNHLINAEQALVNLGFELSIADFASLSDDARATRIRTLSLDSTMLSGINPSRVTSNLLPLRAPFDGVVIGREVVVGEVVQAAQAIFEVADVSTMWVVLNVSKEDARKVAIGQPLRFRPDGSTVELFSQIAWISTEVNEKTRTLEVRAGIANDPSSTVLRAHTFGSGRIEIGRHATALVVPRSSVQWDGLSWVVFVPVGETSFEPRVVTLGLEDKDSVEIWSNSSDTFRPTHVVGNGSHVLKSQILLARMEAGEL